LSIDHDGARVTAPIPDPPPAPPTAVHRRSIIMDSYPLDDEHVTIAGRLTDTEPWGDPGHEVIRQRLGGVSGCSHLGELARAMGPAVVRTAAASRHRQVVAGEPGAGPAPLPLGTCHIWAAEGPGPRKIEAGWVPGSVPFPVPPVAHFSN
jgi:hypothetical protein